MSTAPFSRYILRTTDAAAAGAFYDQVLGRRGDGVVPLHEAALARGARPHWLGHVRARDLGGADAVGARFVEQGATRLGPTPGTGDFVVVRDPGGALVAVTDNPSESSAGVVWHQLNTGDAARAAERYSALFGWSFDEPVELGELGRSRTFGYAPGEPGIGGISDLEGRPGVHPHWLYFFGVSSLDDTIGRVRRAGGVALGPLALPSGARLAVCDDPQGAAFGVIQTDAVSSLRNTRA